MHGKSLNERSKGKRTPNDSNHSSFQFLYVDDVDLDKLSVVRLWGRRHVGYDEFLKVGDQSTVLAISVKRDGCTPRDVYRLGIVDGENLVPDFILTVQEIVLLGFR